MRKLLLLMLLAAFGASVQAQDFTKKELNKAVKMVKNKKLRNPLPYFMVDDFKCQSTIYNLSKIDSKDMAAMRDSAQQRMAENEFLEKAVPLALKNKTAVVNAFLDNINRERLRFEEMEKEFRAIAMNTEASQRKAPKGKLVNVSYNYQAMAYYPLYPITIARDSKGTYANSGRSEQRIEMPDNLLEKLNDIILEDKIYQLFPSYRFRTFDLPDIPQERMLDGMHWSLTAEYDDGTSFSSGGDHFGHISIKRLVKAMTEAVEEKLPAERE